MPEADADAVTVEEYTALLKVAGMVLLCDDCAPHGTWRVPEVGLVAFAVAFARDQ